MPSGDPGRVRRGSAARGIAFLPAARVLRRGVGARGRSAGGAPKQAARPGSNADTASGDAGPPGLPERSSLASGSRMGWDSSCSGRRGKGAGWPNQRSRPDHLRHLAEVVVRQPSSDVGYGRICDRSRSIGSLEDRDLKLDIKSLREGPTGAIPKRRKVCLPLIQSSFRAGMRCVNHDNEPVDSTQKSHTIFTCLNEAAYIFIASSSTCQVKAAECSGLTPACCSFR